MKRVPGIAAFMIAACVIGVMAWGQGDEQLTPRQLFDYGMKSTPAKPAAKPKAPPKTASDNPKPVEVISPKPTDVLLSGRSATAPGHAAEVQTVAYSPLALKYSILQLKGGSYVEVDPDTEFHTDDHVRVKVEANDSSYLYIVMLGSSGQSEILFPSKQIAGGDNRIEKGKPYVIPPNGGSFYFDSTAGVEKLSLALTRKPEQDMEKLIYEAGDPTRSDGERRLILAGNRVQNSAVDHMREEMLSRDLVFEKYDGPASDGQQEKAVYAATKDKSPNARLWVDFKLTHK